MENFGENFLGKKEPEPKPEKSNVETDPETEQVLEMTSAEVAEIKEKVTAIVENELATLSELPGELEDEENIEGLKDIEKEKRGKFKKALSLALVALTAFAITSGALVKKAEAFRVNVNIGFAAAPAFIERGMTYCAPRLVTVKLIDQFGNESMADVVREVCTSTIGNNVFMGGGGVVGGVLIKGGGHGGHHGGHPFGPGKNKR